MDYGYIGFHGERISYCCNYTSRDWWIDFIKQYTARVMSTCL